MAAVLSPGRPGAARPGLSVPGLDFTAGAAPSSGKGKATATVTQGTAPGTGGGTTVVTRAVPGIAQPGTWAPGLDVIAAAIPVGAAGKASVT